MSAWPFPPRDGPVPWTAQQKRDYERQQQQQREPAAWIGDLT